MWSLGAVISFRCNRDHLFTSTSSVFRWKGGKSSLRADQYGSHLRQLVTGLLSPTARERPSASEVLQETYKYNRQRTDLD